MPVMIKLVEHGITTGKARGQQRYVTESIKFFHSLTSTVATESSPEVKTALQRLLTKVLGLLDSNEYLETVAEMACDILNSSHALVTPEHLNVIFRGFGSPEDVARMEVLSSGSDDPEALAYARLCLAFGEAQLQTILHKPLDLEISQFLDRLFQITGRPGTPPLKDDLAAEMLEFWVRFVEAAEEDLAKQEVQAYDLQKGEGPVAAVLSRVVGVLLRKTQLPSTKRWAAMDSADKIEFHGFRRDFQHLLSASYSLIGLHLLEEISRHVMHARTQDDWSGVEAALFAISGLADAAAEDEHLDQPLAALFGSGLWQEVTQPQSPVPSVVRNTAVALIAAYQGFFRRNTRFLEPTIVFLFRCLNHAPLTQTAAKTIAALCDVCRGALAPHATSFVEQYAAFVGAERREAAVKERVAGAVAAVIQGQSMSAGPDACKTALQAFNGLLNLVEADALQAESAARAETGDQQVVRERAVDSMRCLASVGKSSRAPDAATIDLENGHGSLPAEDEVRMTNNLRARIVDLCSRMIQRYADDVELVEAVCNVLRAGIPEDDGPFKLSAADFEAVLGPIMLHTSSPGMALETAARFLRKHRSKSKRSDLQVFASDFLKRVLQMVMQMKGMEIVCS